MLYKVIRIDEDIDFGCEERPEGAPVMAVVTLENAEKDKITLRMEDDLLYERDINESDMVYLDEEGKLAKALGDDWTKRCGSIHYDISSFAERLNDIRQGKEVSWKIMDLFYVDDGEDDTEFRKEPIFSNQMKQKAGFGKGGEKNFDGVLTDLQMKTYLVVRDFRKKKRKKDGAEYGWPIALYTVPEVLWDYDTVAGSYRENPEESLKKMIKRVKEEYPWAKEEHIRKVLK